MVGERKNREQYRWAGWAALIFVVFAATCAYGCGVRDRDGGTDTEADAASPHAGRNDRDSMGVPPWVDVSRDMVASPHPDARTVSTDMDAAHSAAWMEALDDIQGVPALRRCADAGEVAPLVPSLPGSDTDSCSGGNIGQHGMDAGSGVRDSATEASVTPAPPAPTVYVAPPPYAVLDTSVQLTEAQMVDLLRQAGFDAYTWPFMLRIAWCESRFSPNATGAAGEVGLFQVHPRWHPDATYDPLGNAKAAYRISAGGYDYSAWSCRP